MDLFDLFGGRDNMDLMLDPIIVESRRQYLEFDTHGYKVKVSRYLDSLSKKNAWHLTIFHFTSQRYLTRIAIFQPQLVAKNFEHFTGLSLSF